MALEPTSTTTARVLLLAKRLATRSTVLAGVGVFGVAGVAAAAAGAPVPVIESAFDNEGPTLVEIAEPDDREGEAVDEAPQSEPDTAAAEDPPAEDPAAEDGDEADEATGKDTSVPDAAKSDCFKPKTAPSSEEDENEPDDSATETEAPTEDLDPAACEGEFDNHGQYVSDAAKQRNAERKAEKDTAKEAKKADREATKQAKAADRAEKHSNNKQAVSDDDDGDGKEEAQTD